MTKTTWMVRASNGGRLVDEFVEKGVAAIGWVSLGDLNQYKNKSAILQALNEKRPTKKPDTGGLTN